MVTSRKITEQDRASIADALDRDLFHQGTPPEVFYAAGTFANVYEDEDGIVLFLRARKALRIEMVFSNNADSQRNAAAMIAGWKALVENAKKNGFSEIVASTNSAQLREFAIQMFGMRETNIGEEHELTVSI